MNNWDKLPDEAKQLIRNQYYEYCNCVDKPDSWKR